MTRDLPPEGQPGHLPDRPEHDAQPWLDGLVRAARELGESDRAPDGFADAVLDGIRIEPNGPRVDAHGVEIGEGPAAPVVTAGFGRVGIGMLAAGVLAALSFWGWHFGSGGDGPGLREVAHDGVADSSPAPEVAATDTPALGVSVSKDEAPLPGELKRAFAKRDTTGNDGRFIGSIAPDSIAPDSIDLDREKAAEKVARRFEESLEVLRQAEMPRKAAAPRLYQAKEAGRAELGQPPVGDAAPARGAKPGRDTRGGEAQRSGERKRMAKRRGRSRAKVEAKKVADSQQQPQQQAKREQAGSRARSPAPNSAEPKPGATAGDDFFMGGTKAAKRARTGRVPTAEAPAGDRAKAVPGHGEPVAEAPADRVPAERAGARVGRIGTLDDRKELGRAGSADLERSIRLVLGLPSTQPVLPSAGLGAPATGASAANAGRSAVEKPVLLVLGELVNVRSRSGAGPITGGRPNRGRGGSSPGSRSGVGSGGVSSGPASAGPSTPGPAGPSTPGAGGPGRAQPRAFPPSGPIVGGGGGGATGSSRRDSRSAPRWPVSTSALKTLGLPAGPWATRLRAKVVSSGPSRSLLVRGEHADLIAFVTALRQRVGSRLLLPTDRGGSVRGVFATGTQALGVGRANAADLVIVLPSVTPNPAARPTRRVRGK